MIKRITLKILMGLGIISSPQPDPHLCQNPNFHKQVHGYLIYSVPVIGVIEAHENQETYLFLDARELVEYKTSHIPKARHVGYDNFSKKSLKDVDKDTPIIVYCSIGYRSERIGEKLQNMGYTRVKNLYGSIFEWGNMGYPLMQEGKPTNQIHTYNKQWSKWVDNDSLEKIY